MHAAAHVPAAATHPVPLAVRTYAHTVGESTGNIAVAAAQAPPTLAAPPQTSAAHKTQGPHVRST